MACSGNDRAWQAGEPDWLSQADTQMSDLYGTLHEIGDPTAIEAWEALEDALTTIRARAILDAAEKESF